MQLQRKKPVLHHHQCRCEPAPRRRMRTFRLHWRHRPATARNKSTVLGTVLDKNGGRTVLKAEAEWKARRTQQKGSASPVALKR